MIRPVLYRKLQCSHRGIGWDRSQGTGHGAMRIRLDGHTGRQQQRQQEALPGSPRKAAQTVPHRAEMSSGIEGAWPVKQHSFRRHRYDIFNQCLFQCPARSVQVKRHVKRVSEVTLLKGKRNLCDRDHPSPHQSSGRLWCFDGRYLAAIIQQVGSHCPLSYIPTKVLYAGYLRSKDISFDWGL